MAVKRTRQRATGPDTATRLIVEHRFGGRCCRCGQVAQVGVGPSASVQHRTPRAMGGTSRPEINWPCNLVWVCGTGTTFCHGHMESERTEAYEAGWLVRHGVDPATRALLLWNGSRVLLDNDGGWTYADDRDREFFA